MARRLVRRAGFYRVLSARIRALEEGVDPRMVVEIVDLWRSGWISWEEAARLLRKVSRVSRVQEK